MAMIVGTAAALALAGCDLGHHDVADAGSNPTPGPTTACSSVCHGSGGESAPPRDIAGRSDTSSRGVGAHRQHLGSSTWRKRMECVTCHVVPQQIGDPGHIDGMAEVIFTGLGAGATWDKIATTCSNNYCHGATLTNTIGPMDPPGNAGGKVTVPVWTVVDGSQSKCDSCHGAPPPAPHPTDAVCSHCHNTMKPGPLDQSSFLLPETHIDGNVDVTSNQPCDACHGMNGNAYPPKDHKGNTATTARGVGAHAQHMVTGSTWHADVTCDQCHTTVTSVNQQGHQVDPAPVKFGSLGGPGAAWNETTCTNTYCHGKTSPTITVGKQATPAWTQVDGTQSKCDSCHGMAPTGLTKNGKPHPVDSDCGKCHPTMTAGDNTKITRPLLHINGIVETTTDQKCFDCHGAAGNVAPSAPPVDLTGGMTTDLRGVGAHQNHLVVGSSWHKDIACAECHPVPGAVAAIGHIDGKTDVVFGTLSGQPTWNGNTCTNTYCHGNGATLTGGTATIPVWTVVNGAQTQCNACHGAPPPAPHPPEPDPANPNCGKCHNTMTDGGGMVITDPTRHIDGNLDVSGDQACNACHGSGTNAAPPKDTHTPANTDPGIRSVGAHQAHLIPNNRSRTVLCVDCHLVPATVNSVGHIDTPLPAEVIFSSAAGTSPTWNGSSCSNTYCHGATLKSGTGSAGGKVLTPVWTVVDGSQVKCDSCHGNPPPAPHPADPACDKCHTDMSSPTVFSMPAQHGDGVVQVNTDKPCNFCHGGANNAPPQDTTGGNATTLAGVGAHQAHVVTGSAWHKDVTCVECHLVPGAVNAVGHIDTGLPAEMTFSGLAAGTTWTGTTCTSYCHGSTLKEGTGTAGGLNLTPIWTKVDGTQSKCNSCHGMPPPAPHSTSTACETCHAPVAGPGQTIAMPSLHIDGLVQSTSNHPPGYKGVAMHGYDFDNKGSSSCATSNCHGVTLAGGATGGPSCDAAGCHTAAAGKTWRTDCTFCHGTAGGNGAPPAGLFGATAVTDPTVGSHGKHVTAGAMHIAWDCTMCHVKPTDALSPGHVDGAQATAQAELVFSSLNPSGTFAFATSTCSNLYCHGNARTSAGTAVWTSTTAMTCVSCHGGDANNRAGMTTLHKDHHNGYTCQECHKGMAGTTGTTIADVTKHFDGLKTIGFIQAGVTWTAGTKKCSGACHGQNHNGDTWK